MTILPGFTGSLLDRVDMARHDEALVAAMRMGLIDASPPPS